MKKVMLIYGGRSGEHEVSLRSASFVYNSLCKAGFDVILAGINKQGLWYYQNEVLNHGESLTILEDQKLLISMTPGMGFHCQDGTELQPQAVFPLIHGTFGEDGILQGLLEMMDLPYVGPQVLSSALAMDKIIAKQIWECHGLPVVPYSFVESWQWLQSDFNRERFCQDSIDKLDLPLFVKPANAGSSVGVGKAESLEDLHTAIENALQYDRRILIEKAIDAREVELSLLGNHDVTAFRPGEIASTHSFYDYDAKYCDPNGASLHIPAKLTENQEREAKEMAQQAFRALDLRGLSRVDLFLDRSSHQFYINEINTIPGFTSISMFPMLCKAGGLDGPALMKELLKLAQESHKERHNLRFNR